MAKALDGVKVLDFSSYFAGPYCGLLLAMNGAEVTRVEKVGGSEDRKFGPFAPNGDAIFSSVILSHQSTPVMGRSNTVTKIFKLAYRSKNINWRCNN